jgi:hypothetical protein
VPAGLGLVAVAAAVAWAAWPATEGLPTVVVGPSSGPVRLRVGQLARFRPFPGLSLFVVAVAGSVFGSVVGLVDWAIMRLLADLHQAFTPPETTFARQSGVIGAV